jgi:hypothetical protein
LELQVKFWPGFRLTPANALKKVVGPCGFQIRTFPVAAVGSPNFIPLPDSRSNGRRRVTRCACKSFILTRSKGMVGGVRILDRRSDFMFRRAARHSHDCYKPFEFRNVDRHTIKAATMAGELLPRANVE